MARSRRHRPISGITLAESESEDKAFANRRDRHRNRQILHVTGDDTRLKDRRLLDDPWSMAKDGKLRFDPQRFPELMRK